MTPAMTVEEAQLEHMLKDIERDNVSGSVRMARKTAALARAAGEFAEENGLDLQTEVRKWAASAAGAHPFMALVRTVGRRAGNASSSADLGKRMERLLWELANANDRIGEQMVRLFPQGGTFMTNSFSATCHHGLRHLAEATDNVMAIVVESRPAREGVQLARALGEHGIRSTLIVDAGIAQFMERADAVLVGGDTVSGNFFVNKLGTHPMVLTAGSQDVPSYLLASLLKLVLEEEVPQVDAPRSPDEVESSSMANVTVENYYFERIPLAPLTGVVTEDGVLSPEEVARRVASLDAEG
jgi:translation initiation factor 2B subunit (eIF-2B alpha/beta/delta family)